MSGQHRAVLDDDGAVLRYTVLHRPGTPLAASARLAEGRSASTAADAVVQALAGWLVQTDDLGLAAALVKAGARPVRHASIMQCDLRGRHVSMPAPGDLTATRLAADTSALVWASAVASWRAAYPADHPDHFVGSDHDAATALRVLASGAECGPLNRSSALAHDGEGVIRAGVIVTDMPFQPPWHGPWVADIWRDPALRGRGVGRWLLARVQQDLIADGCACLGLAVSAGNPARRTYESIGFHTVAQTATVCLPEANRQSADR